MEISFEDVFRYILKLPLSQRRLTKDVVELRSEIKEIKDQLIPFDFEEMELLSIHQSDKSTKKGFTKVQKGVLNTIYYEPLIAFVVKRYSSGQHIVLATSTSDEFVFYTDKNKALVYINGNELGYLTQSGNFMGGRNRKFGSIDMSKSSSSKAIWVDDKNIGFLTEPNSKENNVPRAFNFIKKLSDQDRVVVLCLTLYKYIVAVV